MVDNPMHWTNHYPADSKLSSGWRYPAFKQLGPAVSFTNVYSCLFICL